MPVYVLDAVTKQISRSYTRSNRVALITDAVESDDLPAPCFEIADEVHRGNLNGWQEYPKTADAIVAFFKGEILLSGELRSVRHLLLEPARQYYVPVHHPGVPALDLIAIEPRWGRRNPQEEVTSSHWRIAACAEPSAEVIQFLAQQTSAWARHSLALWVAREDIGQSIDRLSALLGDSLPPWLQALTLRNLIILLWRSGKLQEGSTLVDRGLQLFPTCAEFFFMAAVREWSAQRAAEALQFAQQAIEIEKKHGRSSWVGSGGEGSYRAHALIATVAEHLGDHKSAFYNFLPGLRTVPPFPESVHGILRQEIPSTVLDWLQLELRNVARMHPEFRDPVIAFLRQNRRHVAASLLEGAKIGVPAPLLPIVPEGEPRTKGHRVPGFELAGPLFVPGQDSRLMRAMAHLLSEKNDPSVSFRVNNEEFPQDRFRSPRNQVLPLRTPELACPGLTIRIHEHPHFDKPESGRLAILLLQQISALPVAWIGAIRRNVDYLLAPSGLVRKALLSAGIPEEKIFDLPPYVDPSLYTMEGERMELVPGSTVFLFPAPCSFVHGIDILLTAWDRAFTESDRTALVIWHDGPISSAAEAVLKRIAARVAQKRGAPVRWLDGPFPDERRSALLRSGDFVVLPFRMEATAQIALDAVACGTPVIASNIEPFREIKGALGDAALFVDGTVQPVPLSETSREIWNEAPLSLEISEHDLALTLRKALVSRTRLRENARQTSPGILRHYGMESTDRICQLVTSLLKDAPAQTD